MRDKRENTLSYCGSQIKKLTPRQVSSIVKHHEQREEIDQIISILEDHLQEKENKKKEVFTLLFYTETMME